MGISFDINSEKWLSIWKLNPLYNPNYYETLKKYFESLCHGMGKPELIQELNALIKEKLEEPLGSNWQSILFTYKNLPALNSMTKSRNPEYHAEYVRKYELKQWLEDIETWIFKELVQMEPEIRFKERQQIM